MTDSKTSTRTYPNTLRARIGRLYLKMAGWEPSGEPPDLPKWVAIAAPHTSNWDLVYMLAFTYHYGISISWMGKDSLFKGPFGGLMRWLGGVPIDRSAPNGVVQQMVDRFNDVDALILAVPPSGTRSKRPYWKTGFYHIAHGAGVPIATGFLDYKNKRGGFGPLFHTTGDPQADIETLREFYSTITGKFPEMTNDIQFKN